MELTERKAPLNGALLNERRGHKTNLRDLEKLQIHFGNDELQLERLRRS